MVIFFLLRCLLSCTARIQRTSFYFTVLCVVVVLVCVFSCLVKPIGLNGTISTCLTKNTRNKKRNTTWFWFNVLLCVVWQVPWENKLRALVFMYDSVQLAVKDRLLSQRNKFIWRIVFLCVFWHIQNTPIIWFIAVWFLNNGFIKWTNAKFSTNWNRSRTVLCLHFIHLGDDLQSPKISH